MRSCFSVLYGLTIKIPNLGLPHFQNIIQIDYITDNIWYRGQYFGARRNQVFWEPIWSGLSQLTLLSRHAILTELELTTEHEQKYFKVISVDCLRGLFRTEKAWFWIYLIIRWYAVNCSIWHLYNCNE